MSAARAVFKRCGDGVASVLTMPVALTCWCESAVSKDDETIFGWWAQSFALIPGPPGIFLRRAFYKWTLQACPRSFYIGFGALFTQRTSRIEEGAYVGAYALIGSAHLGRECLIGSRASLLSGPSLHEFRDGRWLPADMSRRQQVRIGAHAWVGEGAVVAADVGDMAVVAAGAVVTAAVPPAVVVAGNPARFVRRLTGDQTSEAAVASQASASVT